MAWLAGAVVKRSGTYTVTHRIHRPAHQVVLQQGDVFPICRICGTVVEFDFVQSLTESDGIEHIGYDPDFTDSVLRNAPKSA